MKWVNLQKIAVVALMGTSTLTFASTKRSLRKLSEEIRNEVNVMEPVFAEHDDPIVNQTKSGGAFFYLSLLRTRIRPKVSFSVTGNLGIKVAPWVEFYYVRKPPEGWAVYTPPLASE
ncbi:MAG: hypothetical protein HYW48_04820 [Deltaproteobacteria bacterium]|nr:hypothetical protein [Deltaproteobacteria bacterium]